MRRRSRRSVACSVTTRRVRTPVRRISTFPASSRRSPRATCSARRKRSSPRTCSARPAARVCPVQELCEGDVRAGQRPQADRHRPPAAPCHGLRPAAGRFSRGQGPAERPVGGRHRFRPGRSFLCGRAGPGRARGDDLRKARTARRPLDLRHHYAPRTGGGCRRRKRG